jgi:hypothetical protein
MLIQIIPMNFLHRRFLRDYVLFIQIVNPRELFGFLGQNFFVFLIQLPYLLMQVIIMMYVKSLVLLDHQDTRFQHSIFIYHSKSIHQFSFKRNVSFSRTSLVNVSLLYHRQNRRTRNYHTQSFVLCNVEQGASKEVGTYQAILQTSRGAFTHWIGSLRPGFYVLIPFSTSFWNVENTSNTDYTLVIHSKVQINLQLIREPAALLADCLIATVMKGNIQLQKVC